MMKITVWILVLLMITGIFYPCGRVWWHPQYLKVLGQRTVSDVIEQFGPQAEQRLKPHFAAAGVAYPPERVSLLAFKDRDLLEVWAHQGSQSTLVRSYRIQAASGVPGPKLREGDFQVPEGIYQIIAFNPNSAYHLSMKLNYPNAFDWQQARAEGREQPGSDIFIHGKAVSVGCLAMGDSVIEELFSLVYAVGRMHVEVVIAPHDPVIRALSVPAGSPPWVSDLYSQITSAIEHIRQPPMQIDQVE
ncbi:murein L,D-transpeptidase family protein [Marinicella sediminis]|uniref:Murein L,D-transpeptidase family protein n=1 Tax=Marinicella sediminis TaxID=1792834 RepID=A0ABV7J8C9_9GAMM|nr:L,D-transpeptidase family protein [Marinicella sediminis]